MLEIHSGLFHNSKDDSIMPLMAWKKLSPICCIMIKQGCKQSSQMIDSNGQWHLLTPLYTFWPFVSVCSKVNI